jgi:hypothetical protein
MPLRRLLILLPLIIVLFPILACNPKPEGNPKLENVLVQLIQAEKRGEEVTFAKQYVLKLKDDTVQVSVIFAPGQAEIAARAVTDIGGELGAKGARGFDAFVPINKLEALSKEKSIIMIEKPIPVEVEGD